MRLERAGRMVDHPKDTGWRARLAMFALVVAFLPTAAGATGLIGTRAAHMAASQPMPSVAESMAARVDGDQTVTRITFDLSAPVDASAFVLADPDRAIVDLPQIDFKMAAEAGRFDRRGHRVRHANLVRSFRFGLLSPGRSRIVVDLAQPSIVKATIQRQASGPAQLVITLTRTDRVAFRTAARGGALAASSEPAPNVAPVVVAASKPTVVLDPGHGGPDTGAIVNGVIEKDVALAFANMLATKLEASGAFNVVMTRSSDVFIPLSERVRIARAAGAALMISIHADTLTESADVGGATVYTVSDKASDAYAAKVAAKENAADATVGVDGQQDTAEVNDILFDLTRQETRAYSHVFARTLVNYWKVAGRLNKNPQRAAGFVVLKAPDVPSVLLELGYLSNPTDSSELTSDTWRGQATGRMADAILAYFADRRGAAKAAAGIPMPLRQATAETGDLAK